MTTDTHTFTATISAHDVGRYTYQVVFCPLHLEERLPFASHPRLRVEGAIAGVSFEGAFQPSPAGRYLMVNPAVCREAGVGVGDAVVVRFTVADQDAVAVPDELTIALLEDGAAMEAWTALSAGRRRGLCHHVATARRDETRGRRVEAIVAALAAGDRDALPGPPRRRR